MKTSTLTVRVSTETEQRLGKLAAATARSKSFLAAEAIEEYLAVQEWQVQAILDGKRAAAEGDGRGDRGGREELGETTLKVRLTRLAEGDLESIAAFIREDSPRSATKTVIKVLEAVEGLREFPNLGRPGRVVGTRELAVSGTPFIAVYEVRENVLWVLRVLHAARKWPA